MAATPKARLAPTPSGYLHRGNLANFLLNARLGEGGELLLRIDDLDRARFRPEYLEDIFRVVERLQLPVTEGPSGPEDFERNWSQRHRMSRYQEALAQLRDHPAVFACPCTRRELAYGGHAYDCPAAGIDLDRPGVNWRVATRDLPPVVVPDSVRAEGFHVVTHSAIPEFVIRKKDGTPSYQLACVVDDLLFSVNRVGRGQDLLPSTAAQAVLADLLRYCPLFERISFVHHPLLLATDGGKLSKSAGAEGEPLVVTPARLKELQHQVDDWLV